MAKLNSHASIGTSINFVQQMFTFHAELTARIISRSSERKKTAPLYADIVSEQIDVA